MRAAYEVRNPSFSDMNIDAQIEAGINDWCAESEIDGHEYYGQTRDEAERNRCICDSHRKMAHRRADMFMQRAEAYDAKHDARSAA